MTTQLEGPLRRALAIGGDPYVLTITPEGLTLVPKGRRKGYSLASRLSAARPHSRPLSTPRCW